MKTKNKTPKENFYLVVYNLIKQGLYPKQIAAHLGWSEQRLYPYTRRLRKDGMIKKLSQGAWVITKKRLKKTPQDTTKGKVFSHYKEVRGHAFTIKLHIPKIYKWDQRSKYLDKKKITYDQRNGYQSILIDSVKTWICNNSIIFYLKKSFFGKDPEDSFKEMKLYLNKLIKKTEKIFNTSFRLRRGYQFEVKRCHYSLIKNEIAKDQLDKKQKLYCYEDGKLIYLVDNSENLLEFEGVSQTAKEDVKPIQGMLLDLRNNPESYKPSEVTYIVDQLAKNIVSHLNVVDQINELLKELRKEKKKNV